MAKPRKSDRIRKKVKCKACVNCDEGNSNTWCHSIEKPPVASPSQRRKTIAKVKLNVFISIFNYCTLIAPSNETFDKRRPLKMSKHRKKKMRKSQLLVAAHRLPAATVTTHK